MRPLRPDAALATTCRPSPNFNKRATRPNMIVLHYTGMASAEDALERLCNPAANVSAHYLIHTDGTVVQLVAERHRAWHAGVSSWDGETDINSRSIGVEIVNPGHDLGYPRFPRQQIDAVIALCADIVQRHRIRPDRVLAHSDIAPARKRDPGEKFPWRDLAAAGVGLWVKALPIRPGNRLGPGQRGAAVLQLQQGLAVYGYGLALTSRYDRATREAVIAFQRHFRPRLVDGLADASTVRTLAALLEKKASIAVKPGRRPPRTLTRSA